MKKTTNISQRWRKITALFLLVNFFVAPMLNAFPQEDCDSACEMVMPNHDCSSDEMQLNDACCDVIIISNSEILSTPQTECGMEVSDVNCSIVINDQLNTTYIVPKTIDNIVDFVVLPMFNVDEENSSVVIANYAQEILIDSSPPIYLMIASFLN